MRGILHKWHNAPVEWQVADGIDITCCQADFCALPSSSVAPNPGHCLYDIYISSCVLLCVFSLQVITVSPIEGGVSTSLLLYAWGAWVVSGMPGVPILVRTS